MREVGDVLAQRGVRVSKMSLVRLGHAYLEGFVALHEDAGLWEQLLTDPVLLWKIDGTTEGGRGLVWVVECQGYTVAADGVASEKEEYVAPILQEALERTGAPCAVGRDGSTGEANAVARVAPHAVDLECHYHFLKDAGKDLMGDAHAALSKALGNDHAEAKLRAVARGAAGEWGDRVAAVVAGIFESCAGLAFPYRRPALERVQAMDAAYAWVKRCLKEAAHANQHAPELVALKKALDRWRLDVPEPTPVARQVRRLANRLERWSTWFDLIRAAMRTFRDGPQDEAAAEAVKPVLAKIEKKARELGGEEGEGGLALVQAVRDKWDVLFAPVIVDEKPVRVDRTIVDVEQGHGRWKRGVRRRTGKSRVAPALRHHGVGLAHLANWQRPEFRKAVGGWPGFVHRLAVLDDGRRERAGAALARLRPPPGWRALKRETAKMVAAAPASGG